jgi:hypothetical protein
MEDEDDVARRRLRWGLLGAVAVVLIAAIPGLALDRGSDTKHVTSAENLLPGTTTTTGVGVIAGVPMIAAPATTPTVAGSVSPLQATTTVPPARTTTAQPAPAPCHNSYDAKCGPFRWDPDPGPNAPLTVTVSPQPEQGMTPHEVNFKVVADDPDAKIDHCIAAVEFGDGQTGGTCPPPATCPAPYGPWTPPGKVPDHWETVITHTYPAAGPYSVSVVLQSRSFCNPDPYGGSAQGAATVNAS